MYVLTNTCNLDNLVAESVDYCINQLVIYTRCHQILVQVAPPVSGAGGTSSFWCRWHHVGATRQELQWRHQPLLLASPITRVTSGQRVMEDNFYGFF